MKEEFLHFIWKHKLFSHNLLQTCDGMEIEILNVGRHNHNSGPDFFNAQIKINNTIWAGNIEIHLNASDWIKHGHQNDKAYDNVILQVVLNNDKEIFRKNGELIPTLIIECDDQLLQNYQKLQSSSQWIACYEEIKNIDGLLINCWIDNLLIERLEEKSEYISQSFKFNKNSWEETFYQQLARNFGFKVNSEPFEMLAKSLPMKVLAKQKNSLLQIEALLFGQAGFLNDDFNDNYYLNLKNEFHYLRQKFQLKPIEKHLWKFLRLRPSNFPTVRIAQFAFLIYQSSSLFSKIIEKEDIKKLIQLFDISVSGYWSDHYTFSKESINRKKRLGKKAFENIVINTVSPFLFVYGQKKNIDKYKERAIRFLEETAPEKNTIVDKWSEIGIHSENAFISQALVHLKTRYCDRNNCLRCRFGNKIIRGNV